ncbi:glycosyltransferase [Geothermobacter hydrogeniphilus]|uniref:Glycosyl transferase family 1 domain-containing protein n=1 Tax=Geothermobacter hydrogeniphilus TaxID=1969733 RepID=A0A1X0YDW0_9BACT|nr:glycosyltransferase [Geothermobacter hydrogeniphilus]ORJ63395.1 hypothetical protein B5V00_00585 [Geothermobacter hydrogeniphilus]
MKIIYLGLNDREKTIRKIENGELPSNQMYGLIELRKMGFAVTQSSTGPTGKFEKIFDKLNKKLGTNIPTLKVVTYIYNNDVIVVNGPISTIITILCKILNKKIIYLDSVLRPQANYLRRMVYRLNIKMANGTILYSEAQKQHCSQLYRVPASCFKLLRFSIDMPFFLRHAGQTKTPETGGEKYVLSVGRDQARDYGTLIKAMDGIGVKLKIVTVPYLLKDVNVDLPFVEVFENLSYDELFGLYEGASLVVIPLKRWGTQYSSGTTSLLEAIALGKRILATKSVPMMEYADSENGVVYVESENMGELRNAIIDCLKDKNINNYNSLNLNREIIELYDMKKFATQFGAYIEEIMES